MTARKAPRSGAALALLSWAALSLACASTPQRETARPTATGALAASVRKSAARTAESLVGAPYRYGGSSPAGFDCSGLVLYSYRQAGAPGLPHSAARLEDLARPVALDELQPGDLLFFHLSGPKTSHVAVYVGERSFVHAPSSGGHVEKVGFDHVYWGPRLARAGRLGR